MPSFDTPEPIIASLDFEVGNVRITAGKRTDTVVEVLPSNGAEEADVKAVQQTKITYANGTLTVKGAKKRSPFGRHGSIDITVELPEGSRLHSTSPMGDYIGEGTLGECRVKTSLGDISLGETGPANLRTGHGAVRLDRATGPVEISAAGRIDIGEITGTATVKNSNGETVIREVTDALEVTSANGGVTVDTAHASVEVKSSNGPIRVNDVARGVVRLQASAHDIEVGIRASTAAWLDVNTRIGTVRNALDAAEAPDTSDDTVEIHARTSVGDIVIRRA
ncbi:DUF4097 family beta strand repeat-containing protein [Streptomyces sp. NPDC053493]|uniref:DUF4097 family beta strand repeat-containing protein n=1 Tax=Streptomyces sp. NPDC053493 TaxID=3365705 RepID=UPI0037D12096